jgi:CBS domain-containing protein
MFEKTLIREWMTQPVITIAPKAKAMDAYKIIREKNIRRLPVVQGDTVVGILTVGDLREASPSDATTLSIWELNYLQEQITVEQVMTATPRTVEAGNSILDAAELMLEYKVSGLPVTENGKLVGIITESDIFRMLVKQRNQPASQASE